MAKLTLQELESKLWQCADILRGELTGAEYKDYIFGMSFLKRLNDEFDEEEKKRQRTLPSSPSMIFEYRSTSLQIDEDDGDTGNNENMTPDLFTKFMDQNRDKMDNVNSLDQLDVLPNVNNKLESDFNEMRFSNDGIYTPATTVHFTSDEK